MSNACANLDTGNWSTSATKTTNAKPVTGGAIEVLSIYIASAVNIGLVTCVVSDGTNSWTADSATPEKVGAMVEHSLWKFTHSYVSGGSITLTITFSGTNSVSIDGAYVWDEITGNGSASELQSNGVSGLSENALTNTLGTLTGGSCTHLALAILTQSSTWPSGFEGVASEVNPEGSSLYSLYTAFNGSNAATSLESQWSTPSPTAIQIADELTAGGGGGGGSFAIAQNELCAGAGSWTAGGFAINLVGTGNAWTSTTPTFTGAFTGTGFTLVSQSIIADNAATLYIILDTLTGSGAVGTLTITDPSSSSTATAMVNPLADYSPVAETAYGGPSYPWYAPAGATNFNVELFIGAQITPFTATPGTPGSPVLEIYSTGTGEAITGQTVTSSIVNYQNIIDLQISSGTAGTITVFDPNSGAFADLLVYGVVSATATLTGTATAAAVGTVESPTTATLTGEATASAGALVAVPTAPTLTGVASAWGAALVTVPASASLLGVAYAGSFNISQTFTSVTLTSVATAAAPGMVTVPITPMLTGVATAFATVPPPPLPATQFSWYDFEPPSWGEFSGATPTTTGTGSVATQTASGGAGFPDRGLGGGTLYAGPEGTAISGTGMLITLVAGTGTSFQQVDLGAAGAVNRDPLYVRALIGNPSSPSTSAISASSAAILLALNASAAEVWRWTLDSTGTLTVLLASAEGTLTAPLSNQLPWHCVELGIDAEAQTATLWVDGVQAARLTGVDTASELAASMLQFGCPAKDTEGVGTLWLDEVRASNGYIGPVAVTPRGLTASDPARWLAIYNTSVADSMTWVESYRVHRGVPFANLCGLSLPTTEAIDATQWAALRDAVLMYLAVNSVVGAGVAGFVLGFGCPGTAMLSGTQCSIQSLLADPLSEGSGPGSPGGTNPNYVEGVVDVQDLPNRPDLMAACGQETGIYLVGEVNAPTLAIAQALPGLADALTTTDLVRRTWSTLSARETPADVLGAVNTSGGWPALDSFLGTLQAQQVRLAVDGAFTGAAHGDAIEFTSGGSGSIAPAQHLALLASCASGTATVALSGGELAANALAAGYAAALGHVATAGDGLLNPAALIAGFRAGYTLAEAVAIAAPCLRSTWRMLGDPLGLLPLPRQGYEAWQVITRGQAPALAAVAPAGAASLILAAPGGTEAASECWVYVKAVNRLGGADDEPLRWLYLTFDGSGEPQGAVPNPPTGLTLRAAAGGYVVATWRYVSAGQAVPAASFNLYGRTEPAAFNFASPTATVAWLNVVSQSVTIGPYPDGAIIQVIVRSVATEAAGSGEEQNYLPVQCVASATAPAPPAAIAATEVPA